MKHRDWKSALLIFVVLACMMLIGCRTLLDNVTPAPISTVITNYTEEPVPEWGGFTTLKELRDQEALAKIKHREEQIDLRRLAEDDKRNYHDVIAYTEANIAATEAYQDAFVGAVEQGSGMLPTGGLVTLALGLAGGGFLGRKTKRPGDSSPEEVELKIKEALDGNTDPQLS